ncbi:hypothetical protein [Streptomyces sp. NPDC057748]|uniref:hypothetical protein n=1 Tax=unclassified Streptomyces TaxID=2593676 RepID=UPI0036BFB882
MASDAAGRAAGRPDIQMEFTVPASTHQWPCSAAMETSRDADVMKGGRSPGSTATSTPPFC